MRKYLAAAAILAFSAHSAFAQSQAANPVEIFSYGKRAGTSGNPIYAISVSGVIPFASLPATCTAGQTVMVPDAMKPNETKGNGTGVVAYCSGNKWLSAISGAAVSH